MCIDVHIYICMCVFACVCTKKKCDRANHGSKFVWQTFSKINPSAVKLQVIDYSLYYSAVSSVSSYCHFVATPTTSYCKHFNRLFD